MDKETKLLWLYTIGTYVFYLLGAQYIVAPILGWYLLYTALPKTKQSWQNVPVAIHIWVVMATVLLLGIIIAHINFRLGNFVLATSVIFDWGRGWGLFAALIFAGSQLQTTNQTYFRLASILAIQNLIALLIAGLIAATIHYNLAYISPLHLLGRGGEIYYKVRLGAHFDILPIRFSLYTPWAPALGYVSCLLFFMTREDNNPKWRWWGSISAVIVMLSSVSRLGIICLPTVMIVVWILCRQDKFVILAAMSAMFAIAGETAIGKLSELIDIFTSARKSSSEIRDVLTNIGIDRWQKEAPIWGHGTIEYPGPAITLGVPIGTHHTWVSLLFVRGLVGTVAVAFALAMSLMILCKRTLQKAVTCTTRAGLGILLCIFMYSWGETIDSLAYLSMLPILLLGKSLAESN